ncbi:hypothetical protein BU15DRAFT_84980 [Melanogaster broomeanus]|nr:hypothetical protein BU15DRAFT_84980 [Melanogaster broomeanus]
MTRRLLAFVLHATAATIMAWGWFSARSRPMHQWIGRQKGGQLQFLTIQGLAGAWLYMVLSLFCDDVRVRCMLMSSNNDSVVRRVKRALLMIAMPLAFVISTIYWSMVLFVPALILPRDRDMFKDSQSTSSSASPKLMRLPLETDLIIAWFAFPYPFLTHNPFEIRVVIYTIVSALALGCLRVLNAFHS